MAAKQQQQQNDDENAMATDVIAPGANEGGEEPRRPRPEREAEGAGGGGFFTIYKKGQGYWTRMGTAAGAVLIGALIAQFLFEYTPAWFGLTEANEAKLRTQVQVGVAAGFFLVFAVVAWRIMNKPGNADFLIATDSEMKKVNWTSRRELIGSTKVVIIFMFLIAAILFVIDVLFGYLFQFIGVLKAGPFG